MNIGPELERVLVFGIFNNNPLLINLIQWKPSIKKISRVQISSDLLTLPRLTNIFVWNDIINSSFWATSLVKLPLRSACSAKFSRYINLVANLRANSRKIQGIPRSSLLFQYNQLSSQRPHKGRNMNLLSTSHKSCKTFSSCALSRVHPIYEYIDRRVHICVERPACRWTLIWNFDANKDWKRDFPSSCISRRDTSASRWSLPIIKFGRYTWKGSDSSVWPARASARPHTLVIPTRGFFSTPRRFCSAFVSTPWVR